MRSLAIVPFLIMLIIIPGVGNAMHPLLTDDTGTQGTGKFQLEMTATWNTDQEDPDGQAVREIGTIAGVVLTGGVSETLDLMVEVPYAWIETKEAGQSVKSNGITDTALAAKWRFYEKQGIGLAIKPGVLLPTGDETKGLGTGKAGYFATFIAGAGKEPWAADINLAYFDLENKIDERTNIWFGSVAARFQVSGSWKIAGEVGATRNADKADSSHPVFAQVGGIYSPSEDLDVSAGYLMGLTDTETDAAVRLAVTVRF